MAHVTLLPLRINFEMWTAQLNSILPEFSIPLSFGEDHWREWANQFISANELWNVPLATNLVFPLKEDWRKWAKHFIEITNLH